MIMPSSQFHRTNTIESIPEDDELEVIETNFSTGELVKAKDGTFKIPQLNKVVMEEKQVFKSKSLDIKLIHHHFESEPLDVDTEGSTKVKLGKIVHDYSLKKKSTIKTFALGRNIKLKVELDVHIL